MPLESCMILLDNSEFMRNSDYVPTRLEAQHDAANFLVGTKTRSNPESTVGVIAMCGNTQRGSGELLVSPTDDVGKILNALHGVPLRHGVDASGGADLVVSLQVANLALKHRRNKNGAQRVVAFVGSPLSHVDHRAMVKAGRMLKKNNLAIDVVAMGELDENEDKLKELVDAANGATAEGVERTCHLVTIPAGVLPSDVLVTSPIVHGGGAPTGGAAADAGGAAATIGGAGGSFADFGGVDPNMDPELAMALRVSMEEERARQERVTAEATANSENNNSNSNNNNSSSSGDTNEGTTAPTTTEADASNTNNNTTTTTSQPLDDAEPSFAEEDALLQQALAMSMENETPAVNADETAVEVQISPKTSEVEMEDDDDDDEDEDAAMQLALQMSMQPDNDDDAPETKAAASGTDTETATASSAAASTQQFQDPQFVNQLLGSLPGVDTNDPELSNTIRNLMDKKDDGEEKDDKDKK